MNALNSTAYYLATLCNLVVSIGVLFFCGIALLLIFSIVMRAKHPKRDAKYVVGYLVLATLALISRAPSYELLDEHRMWRCWGSVALNAATLVVVALAHWMSERIEVEEDHE